MCDATISATDFEDQDILKIIRTLDINKAHDHDSISVHMIKDCDSNIVKSLSTIFRNSLNSAIFPDNWERSNIVPVHKKGNKQLIQNCRPVSLLPKKKYKYKFVEENNLFCSNQSRFRKTDSCVN